MNWVIIGIHGLNNKPEKSLCSSWWSRSIAEGLRLNCGYSSVEYDFELAYWRDLRHKEPRHYDENRKDENYSAQPYVPADPEALKTYDESMIDTIRNYGLHVSGSLIDSYRLYFGKDAGTGLLKDIYPDLHAYYESEAERAAIRGRLLELLLANRDKKVIVAAHSMGSIISHDVLSLLSLEDPSFSIDSLLTMGSPLGFPLVKYKIYEELGLIATPEAVTGRWINFSDRRDNVCFDEHLHDDFKENSRGIRVRDDLVCNDYPLPKDSPNPHKIYGYLRTPEFSSTLHSILTGKK